MRLSNLEEFTLPEGTSLEEVETALKRVAEADSEQASDAAYHELLYAVGNNHAGTYCSIVVGVLPCLEEIARDGGPWSQRTVFEVLTDLYSFTPAVHQEPYRGASLARQVKDGLARFRPLAGSIEAWRRSCRWERQSVSRG